MSVVVPSLQWIFNGYLYARTDDVTTWWQAVNTDGNGELTVWGAVYDANNPNQKITDQVLDENGYKVLQNAKLWVRQTVNISCNTPLDYLRAKDNGNFDYAFVNSLITQLIAPLSVAPYGINNDAILSALNAVNQSAMFTYASNYADITATAIAYALNAKQFKGDDWYKTAQVQSMIQSSAADALVRIHAYDGKDLFIDALQYGFCPYIDQLMPRWVGMCIKANMSLRDLAEGTRHYYAAITNPLDAGNYRWWGVEAWFRIPIQGYGLDYHAAHPNFVYTDYTNWTLELAQQKVLGDQLMAAQKANGGDDWGLIGAIVAIGIAVATGGAGIVGLISDSIGASTASLSAANAIIATENAIDIASALANASATVAAESQVVALANQSALSLASDAANAVSQATNVIPLANDAAQSFVNATQTLNISANDVVDITQQAQNILDNHAQVIQDALNNVQNNTIPTPDINLSTTTPTVPDTNAWDGGYDSLPQTPTTPTNTVPSITNNIQQIADQIGQKISSLTPSQALSLATTAFKLVSGTGGSTGKPAAYVRQPGAPSTYDQFLQYYQSLNEANNYGIKGNIGPIIDQIGIPLLILVGAYALSKGSK